MNLLENLFRICDHTKTRLQRKPVSRHDFEVGLPGLGNIISVNRKQPAYIYYCPICKSDLPVKENSRWEQMYKGFGTVSKPVAAGSKSAPTHSISASKSKRKPIGDKLRYDVLTRDKYRCVKCGATGKEAELQVDHKIPVAQGGTNDMSNLQTLCRRCNQGKGARRG